ncbi:unnamed protein product [Clavelina lepadiformis]|uniref:G-protein coupled receptors family 1 profile domain-containing protein n=1 Tax=Clavelina lepadiformis TaxID=159417 RepID=A0ABP0GVM7_CLALP
MNMTMNVTPPLINNSLSEATTSVVPGIKWKKLDWMIPFIINNVLMIISVWINASLIHYGIRTNKWKVMNRSHDMILGSGAIYTSVVFCSVTATCRLIATQISFHVGLGIGRDAECEMIFDALRFFSCLTLLSVFVFLWLRQRAFYVNKMMNARYNPILKLLSATSILLIFGSGSSFFLIQTIAHDHPSSIDGCVYRPQVGGSLLEEWLVPAVLTAFGHSMLLFLFIYPLKNYLGKFCCNTFTLCSSYSDYERQQRNSSSTTGSKDTELSGEQNNTDSPEVSSEMKNVSKTSSDQPTLNRNRLCPNVNVNTNHMVGRIMTKTIIFAIISILTSILLPIITINLLPSNGNRRISNLLYDFDAVGNLLLVICSFESYKKMLTSPISVRC